MQLIVYAGVFPFSLFLNLFAGCNGPLFWFFLISFELFYRSEMEVFDILNMFNILMLRICRTEQRLPLAIRDIIIVVKNSFKIPS